MDRNSNPVTMRSVIGVALRKESVDRNAWFRLAYYYTDSRSPQGERG